MAGSFWMVPRTDIIHRREDVLLEETSRGSANAEVSAVSSFSATKDLF